MHEGELVNEPRVQIPLAMLNRHGLIAGATGTGKTKTLQLMAGQLSQAGRTGVRGGHQGRPDRYGGTGRCIDTPEAQRTLRVDGARLRAARAHPVEFLSLSGKLAAPRSARRSIRSGRCCSARSSTSTRRRPRSSPLVFKYCDDNDLPLLDLEDLRDDAEVPVVGRGQADPGRLRRDVRSARRRAAALDRRPRAGGRRHLLRRAGVRRRGPAADDARRARASSSLLELSRRHGPAAAVLDVHALDAGPAVRAACPRSATCPKPKLCFFFDEAHLLFDDASDALMEQIERTARLIRSKGVGVYFVTQVADRRAVVGPGAARQPRPARPPRVHARRRRRAAQGRPDLPDDRLLRRRADDHVARAPARRSSRCSRPRASRPPLAATRLVAAGLADGADRRQHVPDDHGREACSRRSTGRRSIPRAPTRSSRRGSRLPVRPPPRQQLRKRLPRACPHRRLRAPG